MDVKLLLKCSHKYDMKRHTFAANIHTLENQLSPLHNANMLTDPFQYISPR
jgi:hypothetical protein